MDSKLSFNKPEEALIKSRERWQIETLFRGLKTSGFNLENTHVTHLDRLKKLILVVMIAFVWCYKLGDFIDANFKKIKIKKHGNREISVFKHGLEYISRVVISNVNIFNHYQPTKLKNRQKIPFNPCKHKGCFMNQKTYLPLILEWFNLKIGWFCLFW